MDGSDSNVSIGGARFLPAEFRRTDRDPRLVSNAPVVRDDQAARLGILLDLVNLDCWSTTRCTTHDHQLYQPEHTTYHTNQVTDQTLKGLYCGMKGRSLHVLGVITDNYLVGCLGQLLELMEDDLHRGGESRVHGWTGRASSKYSTVRRWCRAKGQWEKERDEGGDEGRVAGGLVQRDQLVTVAEFCESVSVCSVCKCDVILLVTRW